LSVVEPLVSYFGFEPPPPQSLLTFCLPRRNTHKLPSLFPRSGRPSFFPFCSLTKGCPECRTRMDSNPHCFVCSRSFHGPCSGPSSTTLSLPLRSRGFSFRKCSTLPSLRAATSSPLSSLLRFFVFFFLFSCVLPLAPSARPYSFSAFLRQPGAVVPLATALVFPVQTGYANQLFLVSAFLVSPLWKRLPLCQQSPCRSDRFP